MPPTPSQPIIRGVAQLGKLVSVDYGQGPENVDPSRLELTAVAIKSLWEIYIRKVGH